MKPYVFIFALGIGMTAYCDAAEPTTVPAASIVPAESDAPPDSTASVSPVQRANNDAVARLYAQIAAETVGNVPVAQLIEQVNGYSIVMNGLAKAEQIGGPRAVGDEMVQVQLQISGSRAARLVLQAAAVKPEKSPIPPERLASLLRDWNARVFTSTGSNIDVSRVDVVPMESTTAATTSASEQLPNIQLNLDVTPPWANDPLVASATASREKSSLRTARVAEQSAREALRAKLDSLKVSDDRTLAELARRDESIRKVLDEAAAAAKISGVDYRGDGSVELRLGLDGRQLWQAILATR